MPWVLLGAFAPLWGCGHIGTGSSSSEAENLRSRADASLPLLQVRELLEPGAELRPTAKATALAGRRVRLVGFIADMELAPEGALYLVPQPVRCDEAGGGTADLPPETVLVTLSFLARQKLPHAPGLVEVIGTFEVGNRPGPQGHASNFRLLMEPPTTGG